MLRWFRVLCALAPALLIPSHSPHAGTPYDGLWSVAIWTERGDCDRGYRYEVKVEDGRISHREPMGIDVKGRIDPSGTVSVSVRRDRQFADIGGRMARDRGTGTWRGRMQNGECAGTWEAERR